jgi:hypothetical protein
LRYAGLSRKGTSAIHVLRKSLNHVALRNSGG